MAILLTGGAGYIASHICVDLLENGLDVVTVDNYCNSTQDSLDNVEKITGKSIIKYNCDIRDTIEFEKVFLQHKIDCVIHLAGLKAVGLSVTNPLTYYNNNISGTIALLELMVKHNVKNIVFSSSATVYGNAPVPYIETSEIGDVVNPYGRTKFFIEKILQDLAASDNEFSITSLRYFNPIGAHESGLIGDNPKGIPENLVPYLTKVATGTLDCLSIFGDDYPTKDGTCIRDYIHICDLARAHRLAINYTIKSDGYTPINIGSGTGYSVLDIVKNFEKANNVSIKHKIVGRRNGDVPVMYADVTVAKKLLGFSVKHTLEDMCASAYIWQTKNNSH